MLDGPVEDAERDAEGERAERDRLSGTGGRDGFACGATVVGVPGCLRQNDWRASENEHSVANRSASDVRFFKAPTHAKTAASRIPPSKFRHTTSR